MTSRSIRSASAIRSASTAGSARRVGSLPSVRAWAVLALALSWFAGSISAQPAAGGGQQDARGPRVIVVPIVGGLDTATVRLVHRGFEAARAEGIARLVLDIDTPGGPITTMREIESILDSLQAERESRGLVVTAFVRRRALSAGGYLALACDQTYMAPGASIGAITPVEMGLAGMQQIADDDARRKMLSAFRADVRSLVERRGGASESMLVLAEGMVDPRMKLVEATWVDSSGFERTGVVEEDELMRIADSGGRVSSQRQLGVTPLTLTAEEAVRYGFAMGVYSSIEEMVLERDGFRADRITALEKDWSESAVAWLESIKPLLFLFGFLLLMIEFKVPGTMLPGVLGVLLIGLGLFSSYLVGLADWTEILLFVLGLGLVAVEIFLMPGTVVFGLAGFLAILVALILSQQSFVLPSNAAEMEILTGNLLNLLFLILLLMVGSALLYRFLPQIPYFNRALLAPPEDHSRSGDATRFASRTDPAEVLLGRIGLAATDLRPSGLLELDDGRREDVVSQGGFLARGTRVRIVEVEGNRVVVEPAGAEPVDGGGESGVVSIAMLLFLVVVGLGLIVAEVFFVSGGLLGVAAAVSLVTSIFLAFTHHGQVTGLLFLGTAAVGAPATLAFAFKLLPRTALGRKIILSGPRHEDVHGAASEPGLDRFAGRDGVAECTLRPSGFARIDGVRVDVVTRGEIIEAGSAVRVLQVDSNRVLVREIRPDA